MYECKMHYVKQSNKFYSEIDYRKQHFKYLKHKIELDLMFNTHRL